MKTTRYWLGILAFSALLATVPSTGVAQLSTESLSNGASPSRNATATVPKDVKPDASSKRGEAQGPAHDDIEAEREKVWNSPDMLAARAWLETYFERSAKISDAQAKKYMDGLKTMYPDQMKLWLVKFQADRKTNKQQYAMERQTRHQALQARQASPQVGGFQNPYASRRAVSSGQPIGNVRQTYGGGTNPIAQHQPVKKPFEGQSVPAPLVTSREVARWEILRGLGWGGGGRGVR